MGLELARKKVLATAVMAVLALSILSLSAPALSQNQEEQEETEAAVEVGIEVEGNELAVEVEVEGGFEDGEYEIVLDCETKPEGVVGPVLSGTLIVEDGEGEVELEAALVAGEYADCTLTFGDFSQQVGGFTVVAEAEVDEEVEVEEEEEVETEEEIEVEAKIVGTSALAKVKIEFTSSNTDKASLMDEISAKIKLNQETVADLIEIEVDDEEPETKLEVKVEIEDGMAEVEFEYEFVIDAIDNDAIIAAIVNGLQTLELSEDDIEFKEVKGKGEAKGEAKASVAEAKTKAAVKIAEKVKASAEAKGRAEVSENVDKAERYFGKSDKAVVALKLSLASDDPESISFGSAQLILIKFGEQEPRFRAVIHILTDQPADTMTACLDGEKIGELEVIDTSAEAGITIGRMRQSLTGMSITIPGVTVDIVKGTDCTAAPIVSGSV